MNKVAALILLFYSISRGLGPSQTGVIGWHME